MGSYFSTCPLSLSTSGLTGFPWLPFVLCPQIHMLAHSHQQLSIPTCLSLLKNSTATKVTPWSHTSFHFLLYPGTFITMRLLDLNIYTYLFPFLLPFIMNHFYHLTESVSFFVFMSEILPPSSSILFPYICVYLNPTFPSTFWVILQFSFLSPLPPPAP